MRIGAKGIGGIAAIAMATAFAGCQCSVGSVPPPAPPPPPAAAPAPPAPVSPAAASTAHPPAIAPLSPAMRERLEHRDGGT
jgi:hypothetical protein